MTFIPEGEYQTLLLGNEILPARDNHTVRITTCEKPEYLESLEYKRGHLENREKVYFNWNGVWYVAKCLKRT